jgi:hypothetical protein
MSFELSEFQFGTVKSTCNLRVHEPQIRVVNHDHFVVITWFGTHHHARIEEKQFQKRNSQAQDSTSYSLKTHCKAIYPDRTKNSQAQRLSKKDSQMIDHHLHRSWSRGWFLKICP